MGDVLPAIADPLRTNLRWLQGLVRRIVELWLQGLGSRIVDLKLKELQLNEYTGGDNQYYVQLDGRPARLRRRPPANERAKIVTTLTLATHSDPDPLSFIRGKR